MKIKGQNKGASVSKCLLMKPTHTLSWKAVIQVPTSNQTVMCSVMLPPQVNTGIQMLVYQYPVDEIENEILTHVVNFKGHCQKKSCSLFRSDAQSDEAHCTRIPDQP